jgi:hypothetical protein
MGPVAGRDHFPSFGEAAPGPPAPGKRSSGGRQRWCVTV